MWRRLTFQPDSSKSSNEEQGFKVRSTSVALTFLCTKFTLGVLIQSSILFGTKSLTVWLSQEAKCQLHHAPHLLHPHQLLWHSGKTNICTRTVKDTDQLKACSFHHIWLVLISQCKDFEKCHVLSKYSLAYQVGLYNWVSLHLTIKR